jgi:hypothetical protein
MAALAHQNLVHFLRMPIVLIVVQAGAQASQSPDAKKAAKVGEEAVSRVQRRSWAGLAPSTTVLDPISSEAGLRAYANQNGIDFDELVDRAARNFAATVVTRRLDAFSREELEFLFEDDQRAFNRRVPDVE